LISLKDIAEEAYDTATDRGFWNLDPVAATIGAKFALIHSEVSEAMDEWRKHGMTNELVEEFADVYIRLADLTCALTINSKIEDAIEKKMAKNKERPYMHGGRGI
jgi:NTP pyrophosphatase (non-canonical NTP hydrolase)